MRRVVLALTTIWVVMAAAVTTRAQLAPLPFGEGDVFPNIVLPSLSGEQLSIASFRGTKTILHIFASW